MKRAVIIEMARHAKLGSLMVVLLLGAGLSGCAWGGGGNKSAETVAPVRASTTTTPAHSASDVMQFIAQAHEGEQRELRDPYFGGPVKVTFQRQYHAASGRTCRRFLVQPGGVSDIPRTNFACFADGYWHIVRLDSTL